MPHSGAIGGVAKSDRADGIGGQAEVEEFAVIGMCVVWYTRINIYIADVCKDKYVFGPQWQDGKCGIARDKCSFEFRMVYI